MNCFSISLKVPSGFGIPRSGFCLLLRELETCLKIKDEFLTNRMSQRTWALRICKVLHSSNVHREHRQRSRTANFSCTQGKPPKALTTSPLVAASGTHTLTNSSDFLPKLIPSPLSSLLNFCFRSLQPLCAKPPGFSSPFRARAEQGSQNNFCSLELSPF